MSRDSHERDELLDQYWAAVAEDPDAAPPEGVDPLARAMVRDLRRMQPPEPDPAFTARLGERIRRQAAQQRSARRPRGLSLRPAPAHAYPWSRPLLAGLAAAAVLLVAVLGLQLCTSGTRGVSATEILQ